MRCENCSEQFTIEGIRTTCGECDKSPTCRKVRCPACGADNPRTPDLVMMMKDLI